MIRLSLRRLTADKRRALGSGLAIILGVAFLAATLVLGDTMRAGFEGLFGQANAGIDLAVRNGDGIGSPGDESFRRGPTDGSLVAELGRVPGVAAVAAQSEGVAQIIDTDGQAIGGGGPPTVGSAWIDDPELNPYRIREGRGPARSGEVVIDALSAETGEIALGDTIEVRVPDVLEVKVVGIAGFGGRDSMAGTTLAAFDPATAQRWFAGPGQVSSILLRAEGGTSPEALRDRVEPVVGRGQEVLTGDELTAEQEKAVEGDFLGFLRTALLAFAGVALVVAGFSIYNTFSIMVSHQSRESSLLRALGASRAQVLRAVAIESLAIGLLASLAGTGVGILLADGLQRLLASAGMDLGLDGLTINGSALAVSVGVGLVITFLSSVIPAMRSSRAAPLAALRSAAVEATSVGRRRATVGAAALSVGVGAVVASGFVSSNGLTVLSLGALSALVGTVLLAPLAAVPIGQLLGAGTRWLWPSGRVGGRLAGRNVVRNPRRTASSAVALVVGVTVVTVFATMAASMKTAMNDTVDRTFAGDLVVSSSGAVGIDPALIRDIGGLAEVDAAVPLSPGQVRLDGHDRDAMVTDVAELAHLAELRVDEGSLAGTGPGEVAVSRKFADEHDLSVGSKVAASFADGETTPLTVGAIYRETDMVGSLMVNAADYLPHEPRTATFAMFVSAARGVAIADAKAAVVDAAGRGGPTVQTRQEFTDSVAGQLDQLLILVYGLLGLAILIALMGIANTMALSMHERTRESGLLRALGQSRRQLRATVRWESVVTAVLGTVGGLALGAFLGWGVMRAAFAESETLRSALTIPTSSIAVIVVMGVVAGVLASVRPARRAARLDVLDALTTV